MAVESLTMPALNSMLSEASRLSQTMVGEIPTASAALETFSNIAGEVRFRSSELGSWASAKTLDAGSAARKQAREFLEDKVRNLFGGDEIWGMLDTLSQCIETLSKDLKLDTANIGITFALPLVALQHCSLKPVECIGQLEDFSLVTEACYWVNFAIGAYGAAKPKGLDDKSSVERGIYESATKKPKGLDEKSSVEVVGFRESAVIAASSVYEVAMGEGASDGTAESAAPALEGVKVIAASLPAKSVKAPGYFVAIDRTKKAVVLGIRGTSTPSDAVTDAVGKTAKVTEELSAHQAMYESAQNLIKKTRSDLEEALSENSDFTLIVTGHSLGAGTSILCSILLNAEPVFQNRLRCFAFAPPPVVSSLTASAVQAVEIHSFVNRADVVPCASLANVFHLGEECMAVDKLDLDMWQRFLLIGCADTNDEDQKATLEQAKNSIMEAVSERQQTRKQEPHQDFPPLLIAGNVYWIKWDSQPDGVQDSDEPVDDRLRGVYRVDAKEFQALRLRGGRHAFRDHSIDLYKEGLDGHRQALEAKAANGTQCGFCACQ